MHILEKNKDLKLKDLNLTDEEDTQLANRKWKDAQHHLSLEKCKLNYAPIRMVKSKTMKIPIAHKVVE